MELWMILSIFAAFFQVLRSAGQKLLTGKVDPILASGSRFIFGFPVAIIMLLASIIWGYKFEYSMYFWIFCFLSAATQISASLCVTYLFRRKNFTIGNTLTKTEVAFIPIISLLLLNERLSFFECLAILIVFIGTMVASLKVAAQNRSGFLGVDLKTLALGLGAGFFFALTSVLIRIATTTGFSEETSPMFRAILTVSVILSIQTVYLLFWLFYKHPKLIEAVKANYRICFFTGFTAYAASFCWFYAYTLISASLVKAVGQVEFIFMLFLTYFFFKEKVSKFEWIGAFLIVTATIMILILV